MANRYIIDGAAFCGDGTSSAEATIAGGVGAWNTLRIFDTNATTPPPYGTLPAGSTVYIRSKDAADAAITIAMGANLTIGAAAATSTAWITWVIDDGTVWPGVSGVITITNSAYSLLPVSYNNFIAKAKGSLAYVITGAASLYSVISFPNYATFTGLVLNSSAQTSTGGIRMLTGSGITKFVNCDFFVYKDAAAIFLVANGYGAQLYLFGCNVRLDVAGVTAIVNTNSQGVAVYMEGCKVYGAGAEGGAIALSNFTTATSMRVINTFYPPAMKLFTMTTTPNALSDIYSVLCDGLFGSEIRKTYGYISSRDDGFFPKLNATLPAADITKWSYYCYPTGASEFNPFRISLVKYVTSSTATKTITANVLVSDTYTAISKANMWAEVSYVDDTTGNVLSVTTRDFDGGALDSNTASWTSTSYGALSLASGKKQLSVTTPTTVRTNTTVSVTVFCASTPVGVNDLFFLCPDFLIV